MRVYRKHTIRKLVILVSVTSSVTVLLLASIAIIGFDLVSSGETPHKISAAQYIVIAFVSTVLAVLIALFFGSKPQRAITRPLRQLAETAKIISEHRDYSIRVQKHNENEVAELVDAFDEMLNTVEQEIVSLIRDLKSEEEESEKIAYTVSHDLRSPLVTIKGFLDLLDRDLHKGKFDRWNHYLERIETANNKMSRLLNDLLEFSRIGRMFNLPEEFSLTELAHEAAEIVSDQAMEPAILIEISPDLPIVLGDRPRLMEVFRNMIDNAVKFMGDQPDPLIEIGSNEIDGETAFYVRDNGMGIEPRYQEEVFGIFDRLHQDIEGTGIGLAIVKRVLEVHGGDIWIESEGQGKGTTFWFTMKLAEQGVAVTDDKE